MSENKSGMRKSFKLFDVYVISTGAMFSSGFFLLPGLAASETGPSVVLAYFLSGVLIIPALLSVAELSTAMPRAGGTYYFLDRTLGPLMGTVGGIATWLALMLKSAFALIGMGAYVSLVAQVDMRGVALGFLVVFTVLNIMGAKETTKLLRVLVIALLLILLLFLAHGVESAASVGWQTIRETRFRPFLTNGFDGLVGTIGLVFVSYIGLTKVASVAEEVENPDRNIPLGMILALVSVVAIYVVGISVMVIMLGTDLNTSLTPVADAALIFFTWIPARWAELLIVVAAVAAFASMSNAGILASSRYPLAMARDRLLPHQLSRIGKFGTPVSAIALTSGVMVVMILALDVESVAKLASALQLWLFAAINVSVIVMRESRIDSYDPGFRGPLYPWVHLVGIIVPFVLVAEMGWLPAVFTLAVAIVGFLWYKYYARERIERDGAIYHVFERLGRRRFAGLDQELRDIIKEKGMRAEDPFDEIVARALVLDEKENAPLDGIIVKAADLLSHRVPLSQDEMENRFRQAIEIGGVPIGHGIALFHTRAHGLDTSELAFARCINGISAPSDDFGGGADIHAVFFLISGEADPGRHLRILAHLAGRVESESFQNEWLSAQDEQDMKETLLRDERFLTLKLSEENRSSALIGSALHELRMPEGCLVALIRRHGVIIVPRGGTVLRSGDRLTIIGEPAGLGELEKEFAETG